MARVLHARHRTVFADRMRNVGKRPLDESGKYLVNEDDEEIFAQMSGIVSRERPRVPTHSVVLSRHCEERKRRSNPSVRYAALWIASRKPVIGRAFARPVGSQ
ncbi:hypothetical protein J6524_27565 [Bradyrhizobium sp. WSM 1738]|uniref:hypothetical protein n=1 Tax=Bradyrhizobium hereditatis TaxID=2821405 RepID=UPI001CE25CDB|nr:hypothetical protein [Bradyrhizobium hereditatis]MCA6118608.1 hypothetical protein [Bradyrhizobium hereditatis]